MDAIWPFEKCPLLAAVFEPENFPALGLKEPGNLFDLSVERNMVETLAMDVDDPLQFTESVTTGFTEGFWHVALIDFGISHQCDVTTLTLPAKVVLEVALGQGAKNRRRRS